MTKFIPRKSNVITMYRKVKNSPSLWASERECRISLHHNLGLMNARNIPRAVQLKAIPKRPGNIILLPNDAFIN